MKKIIPLIIAMFFFTSFSPAFAETKTFVKEYTYQASDEDSKNSSRTLALREVKRLLLEELGTYLESESEVKEFQLTKDQITTLTAGIVKTEIVGEKWDGRTYWLKARIAADSGEVIKSIDTLRKDRQKTKELEEVRRRSDELLIENARLRKELETATGVKKQEQKAAYNKTIKELTAIEWFEKGRSSAAFGRYNDEIEAYSKAIELNQDFLKAYNNRGFVYLKLGHNGQALEDFNKAIELNPKDAGTYNNRGLAYANLGNDILAIKDYDKAIELNIVIARKQPEPGAPRDLLAEMGINPGLALAYHYRGLAYHHLGNYNQAIQNHKEAARWGSNKAQDYLKKQGIDW